MPFLAHFNLKQHPFSLTPNSHLYFPSPEHQRVLVSLLYLIHRREGILKVVGEVGTGKTLLARLLVPTLIDKASVAYIINPQNDARWVVAAICREFGLDPDTTSDPLHALNTFLLDQHQERRGAVVVVDEAQALGPVGLETVRRLSNLETDKRKLLQIVLFGQPELERLLQTHTLRQLNQRIGFSFTIEPLAEETAIQYIRYRVERSTSDNGTADRLFEAKALRTIARAGRGNPRVTNIIADKSLLAAYGDGATRVRVRHVREAVADSRAVVAHRAGREAGGWRRPALAVALTSVVVLAVGAAGWVAVDDGGTGLRWWLADRLLDLLGVLNR